MDQKEGQPTSGQQSRHQDYAAMNRGPCGCHTNANMSG